jgi:hypothetical protein
LQGSAIIPDLFHFVTFYMAYALILAEFVLSVFADTTVAHIAQTYDVHHVPAEERVLLSSEAVDLKVDSDNKKTSCEGADAVKPAKNKVCTGL